MVQVMPAKYAPCRGPVVRLESMTRLPHLRIGGHMFMWGLFRVAGAAFSIVCLPLFPETFPL